MKNKSDGSVDISNSSLKLKMRLSFILFFAFIFSAVANSFSQTEISLELRDVKVIDVLDEIEVGTDYKFFYNTNIYDFNKVVSINVTDEKISNILDQIFNGTIQYEVIDKRVILKKKNIIVTNANNEIEQEEIIQRVITGTVKDTDGIPLPGATVLEEGTNNGTSTDFDGNFSINLENDDSKLTISFIGYLTESYETSDLTSIDAILVIDNASLDEVVVTGFGTTQQKKLVTGSIATISSDVIENRGLTSAGLALAGTTAGVIVTQNSGQAGRDDVQFRIRGYGTINDASPLIIIDGFEGDFNSLNPNDIESVSVLKDAASAAIYGNRAANGVILVKTKRGRKNQDLNITYDMVVGSAEATIDYPLVYNPAELARVHNQAKTNYGLPELFPASEIAFLQSNVDSGLLGQDAQDIFFRTGTLAQHTFGISGGSEKTNYRVSLGLLDQEGMILGNEFKRYNGRFNLDSEINDKIRFGTTLSFVRGDANSDNENENSLGGALRATMDWYTKFAPIYNTDGSYAFAPPSIHHGPFSGNRMAESDAVNFNRITNRFLGNAFIEFDVIEGLTVQARGGVNYTGESHYLFHKALPVFNWIDPTDSFNVPANRRSDRSNIENFTATGFLTAQYEKSFGEHNVDILAGAQTEDNRYTFFTARRNNHLSDAVQVLDGGDAATATNAGTETGFATISYFTKINYNFNEKLLFSLGVRYDGSSRFAEGNKWGTFPQLSAGYIIFDDNSSNNLFSFMKVRGSWGQSGNAQIGNFEYARRLALNQAYSYGGVSAPGVGQSTLGNPNLTWETATLTDFGFDFSLKNGLYGEFDYYVRDTEDVLFDTPVNSLTGIGSQLQNAINMENSGIEILLGYRKQLGELTLSGSLNYSTSTSEIKSINPQGSDPLDQIVYGGDNNGSARVYKVGEQFGSFYGFKTFETGNGIIQNASELGNGTPENPTQLGTATVGDLRYQDLNGDGKIDTNDRTVIGCESPGYSYGFQLNANYKNFDLGLIFQGIGDVQYNGTRRLWRPFLNQNTTVDTRWLDAWTPTNTDATFPKIFDETGGSNPGVNGTSDFWVLERDYLRLKNLQIGYTVPSESLPVDYLRVYFNATNLFTITDLPELVDPEGINGDSAARNLPNESDGSFFADEATIMPQQKTIQLGISIRI